MAAETFKKQYEDYQDTLTALKNQCAQAEKSTIVAETNLKTLTEQHKKLMEECEKFAGVPLQQVPDMLKEKEKELNDIMAKLSAINITGEITKDTLDSIQAIIKEYNIAAQED